jgi:glycosyltransferase involved in cell wall biosynthesis
MRVLRVLGSLDPKTGGPPSVFSAAVISSAAAGATVECLTFQTPHGTLKDFPDYQRLVDNGIKVHAVRDLLRACAFVFQRSKDFDIIHVDGCWVPVCILAVLIAKLTGLRSAVTPHETLTLEERRRTRSRLRAITKLLLTYYYRKIAGCIIYSSTLECRDSPRHPNSVVIPHPVFDDSKSAAPIAIRSGFADLGSIRLGYLGRFHPKKNLEHIVAACLRTANIRLLLAGSGTDAYERTIRTMDNGNGTISWLGFLQKAQREEFFHNIDFLVLASEYECFGMAAAEALVRGIPVIVTQRVGVADDVRRTGGGLVVPVAVESLVTAFEQCSRLTPAQYLQLQDRALKAAVRYSYSVHGQSQVRTYRSMLEQRITA